MANFEKRTSTRPKRPKIVYCKAANGVRRLPCPQRDRCLHVRVRALVRCHHCSTMREAKSAGLRDNDAWLDGEARLPGREKRRKSGTEAPIRSTKNCKTIDGTREEQQRAYEEGRGRVQQVLGVGTSASCSKRTRAIREHNSSRSNRLRDLRSRSPGGGTEARARSAEEEEQDRVGEPSFGSLRATHLRQIRVWATFERDSDSRTLVDRWQVATKKACARLRRPKRCSVKIRKPNKSWGCCRRSSRERTKWRLLLGESGCAT